MTNTLLKKAGGMRDLLTQLQFAIWFFHPKELPAAVSTQVVLHSHSLGTQLYWRWHTAEFSFPREEVSGGEPLYSKRSQWSCFCTACQISLQNASLTALHFFVLTHEGHNWQITSCTRLKTKQNPDIITLWDTHRMTSSLTCKDFEVQYKRRWWWSSSGPPHPSCTGKTKTNKGN